MTCTEEAILAAVTALPEDDLPRLAYADFREEQGDDARAEFIRVQLELARLGDPDPPACGGYYCDVSRDGHVLHRDCRGARLRERERQLLHDPVHWWAWLADLYRITGRNEIGDMDNCSDGPDSFAVRFRRGFVEEVRLPCLTWDQYGPALALACPLGRAWLGDKSPAPRTEAVPQGPDGCFGWRRDSIGPDYPWYRWDLPRHLHGALRGFLPHPPSSRWWRWYGDKVKAERALSDACLSWARAAPVAAPSAAGCPDG